MNKVHAEEDKRQPLNDLTCFGTQEQSMVCRICLEGPSANNDLISICKCSGSVKFVHEECTKTWILSREEDIENARCELCLTKFQMDYRVSTKCSIKHGCQDSIGQCIIAPLLVLVLGLLSLIMYIMVSKVSETENSEMAYTIALIIICALSFLIIFILVGHTVRENYFVSYVSHWKINPVTEIGDTGEVIESEESIGNELPQRTVLVMPRAIRAGGRMVQTPEVAPLNLTAVNNRGQVVAYIPSSSRSGISSPVDHMRSLSATGHNLVSDD